MDITVNAPRNRARSAWAWAGLWGLLTAIFAIQDFFYLRSYYPELAVGYSAAWSTVWAACEWMPWLLLTPLVLWCARRWPLTGPQRAIHLFILLVLVTPVIAVKIGMQASLNAPLLGLLGRARPFEQMYMEIVLTKAHAQFVTAGLIIGFGHVALYADQLRRRVREEEELRRMMMEKELEILRYQIQPHFLFNTLNSIASVVDNDGPAQRMIVRLGDYLRRLLRRDARAVIDLADEIDALRDYLSIEQIRLGKRLRVDMRIDPLCAQTQVPALVLQPIVENAIRHGVARRSAPSQLSILAALTGDRTRVVIEDRPSQAAQPPTSPAASGLGIGLENCRKRLALLYGADALLEEQSLEGQGFRVTLEVPVYSERMAA